MNFLKTPWLKPFGKTIFRSITSTVSLSEEHASSQNVNSTSNLAEQRYGQPTPSTHPHLFNDNELLPGLPVEEFVTRRDRLARNLINSSSPDVAHLAIIPSSSVKYMSERIPYVFRQNSDFRYLSGCLEPDSALVLVVHAGGKRWRWCQFLRGRDPHKEMWEGHRTGVHEGTHFFAVDDCLPVNEFEKFLKNWWKDSKNVVLWYDFADPIHMGFHKHVLSFVTASGVKKVEPIKPKIHELRLIKSKAEMKLMRRSAKIASEAIEDTMRFSVGKTSPINEYELFAKVDYECRMRGAEFLAYPPVVAGGDNATIIHYINNNRLIDDNAMVLMDAGCELHGYTSDITRTWPISGRFTDHQRTLYEIILDIQTELLMMCRERPSLEFLFRTMCRLLGQRLKESHILTKATDNLKPEEAGFKLCPHHVGHFLGMDVHDTGSISRKIPCKEGMVITVEPGIYVDSANSLVKEEFRGMGIRIEDDVLFTGTSVEVISSCSKSVADVEKLLKKTGEM